MTEGVQPLQLLCWVPFWLFSFWILCCFMPWHFVNWSWLNYPFNMQVISFLLFRLVFWHSCIRTCVHVVIQFSWYNKKLTSRFCRMVQNTWPRKQIVHMYFSLSLWQWRSYMSLCQPTPIKSGKSNEIPISSSFDPNLLMEKTPTVSSAGFAPALWWGMSRLCLQFKHHHYNTNEDPQFDQHWRSSF